MIFASGTPFIQYGTEFGRSKQMNKNSYRANMDVNGVDFNQRFIYQDVITYLKKLIAFKKEQSTIFKTYQGFKHSEIKFTEEEGIIHYSYGETELIITNNYNNHSIYNDVINRPGLYLYKEGIRIL